MTLPKFPREFYAPKGAMKVSDKIAPAVVYIGDRIGKPVAVGFYGKAQKPEFNYSFKTPESRARFVTDWLGKARERFARIEANKAERKAELAKPHQVQVGDIFRTSWGYDQTNVEFFEVTQIKGKYAILREVEQASESNGYGQDKVVPQSGKYLEPRYPGDDRGLPIRRLIQPGRFKIDDVRDAWPWGKRDPITGTVIGKAAYATSLGWGH